MPKLSLLTFLILGVVQVVLVHTDNTPCLCLEEIASGMVNPLVLVEPNDGTGRLFVTSQDGFIHIYFRNGSKLQEPFVNIRKRLLLPKPRARGLFGMAIHPNFPKDRRFYVFYTTTNTVDKSEVARLSEMKVSKSNPNRADDAEDQERILVEILKPKGVHNGGQILFDSNEYLYLFVGDGGIQGDPFGFAQNKSVLLGKILRFDVSDDSVAYKIPKDNPFVEDPSARHEVYAYGLRVPFSGGLDPGDRQTSYGKDRIIFGDVGWRQREELNFLPKNGGGSNFGWNLKEGFLCHVEPVCPVIENEVLPILDYQRNKGVSITGGNFYRGCQYPSLNGVYFYGDWGHGTLWSLKETAINSKEWVSEDMLFCEESVCSDLGLKRWIGGHVYGFANDVAGDVYILSATTSEYDDPPGGSIHRIVDPQTHTEQVTCEKCGLDKKWKAKVKSKGLKCLGKNKKGCTCKEILAKSKKLFKSVCKKDIKGGRKACCKLCKKMGFPYN